MTSDQGSERYGRVAASFSDTDQFAVLGFSSLAITSVVSAIDLCAAAVYRLEVGDPGEYEANMRRLLRSTNRLSPETSEWSRRTDGRSQHIRRHRNDVAHRQHPMHHTIQLETVRPIRIGGQPVETGDVDGEGRRHVAHRVDINEARHSVDDLAKEGLTIGVDALVSLCGIVRDRYTLSA